jgi:hypothetical protein
MPKRVKIFRASSVFFFGVRWRSVLLGTSEFTTPEPAFLALLASRKTGLASYHILGIDFGSIGQV